MIKTIKLNVYKYVVLIVSLVPYSVFAQNQWGVGFGGLIEDQGYIDIGSQTTPIPIIYFESENLQVFGPTFNYKIATFDKVNYSFVGQYRFDGYEANDGDIFRGMDDRLGAFDIGISINYKTNDNQFTFLALTDVSKNHNGYEINLTYSKYYHSKLSSIIPYVTIIQKSDELVDYYYGVQADEATVFRSSYYGEATMNIQFGIRSNWRIGKHHNFTANAYYMVYGNNIKNSPLIDSSGKTRIVLGYMYVF
jgi:outer membrane protein